LSSAKCTLEPTGAEAINIPAIAGIFFNPLKDAMFSLKQLQAI
jgi:hypothetical protein